jgi:hypothetical protein
MPTSADHRHPGQPRPPRGLAVYLFVVGVTTMLAVTGLTLVAIQRADQRVYRNLLRTTQAQYVALAGIDKAFACMDTQPTWRQSMPNGTWFLNAAFGPGRYTLLVADSDGSLADNETDSVLLTSTATVEDALCRVQVSAVPTPYPALQFACAAMTTLEFKTNAVIRGPVRANAEIVTDGTANPEDNAVFETLDGYLVPSSLQPVRYVTDPFTYPQPDLAFYLALSTPITGVVGTKVTLYKYSLTPMVNSESPGQVNLKGIYSLNAAGREVVISNSYIQGTLIIYNTASKLTIQGACRIEPADDFYPTLLIYTAGANVDINLDVASLSEVAQNNDFDGNGIPTDSFPTLISGVVWTQGSSVEIHKSYAKFIGCLLGNAIKVYDYAEVDEDPALARQYMPGFVDPQMKIVAGSWREVQP